MTRPEPVTIDGRELCQREAVDALVTELELTIGRLRRKLDESYDRGNANPRPNP